MPIGIVKATNSFFFRFFSGGQNRKHLVVMSNNTDCTSATAVSTMDNTLLKVMTNLSTYYLNYPKCIHSYDKGLPLFLIATERCHATGKYMDFSRRSNSCINCMLHQMLFFFYCSLKDLSTLHLSKETLRLCIPVIEKPYL